MTSWKGGPYRKKVFLPGGASKLVRKVEKELRQRALAKGIP